MKIIKVISSGDKKAHKVLQLTKDNYVTETGVFDDGDTCHLCLSCQIGCPISCKMCYNGINKNYVRCLEKEEIIDQAINIIRYFDLPNNYINVCFSFMGVGEPLLNYHNVIEAVRYLNESYKNSMFALATTLPKASDIHELTKDFNCINHFKLTISLHAPNDLKRKELIGTHTSMEDLRKAMDYYRKNSIHKGEFNYLLLSGFNDSDTDFNELLCFLDKEDRVKISSYNTIENGNYDKSDNERYRKLHLLLDENGIYNAEFNSVGDSIDVGCGQMASKKMERIRKNV